MFSRLKFILTLVTNFFNKARVSLFNVPLLISLSFIGLTFVLIVIDENYTKELESFGISLKSGMEQTRAIVSVALSLMVTMTTLVISITMVVLSLSASQLGPRLINIFMKSKASKIHIGIFFGTIGYIFVLFGASYFFILESSLSLTVLVALVISFFNLFALLSYVNHMAHSSNADNITDSVEQEFFEALASYESSSQSQTQKVHAPLKTDTTHSHKYEITSYNSGYIQFIDYESVFNISKDMSLYTEVEVVAGDYVVKGQNVITVFSDESQGSDLNDRMDDCLLLGEHKTSTQDEEYYLMHLTEIGLRALSPGINDHFTALRVVDKLSNAINSLKEIHKKERKYFDEKENLVVLSKRKSISSILYNCFQPIREAGKDKPDILIHLLKTYTVLKTIFEKEERCLQVINEEISMIRHYTKNEFKEENLDRKKIELRLEML